ncbi:glycosyl hydrolase family 3 C-terminal domain-containing protein [Plectosphaerella cucumerina]|uniref:Probable beta-glucosidase G n=1 Tax=Plectosphaerella cucumerina TaxID=40658 RepID=A0A8K0X094_9PEZI|nr:glycosyl hydrolase family 3 C-terminal domain-containing protein [Plectosphaerella cucumerina]
MTASVTGLQSVGVQACSKHFIGNEQETQRSSTTSPDGIIIEAISANIDDRTLHELYLWPFADAVKAGSASVMCAYNRINGDYSCGSAEMLSILKDELAFPGYVVSDWFATHGTADFANAGLDLEMPGIIPAVGIGGQAYMGDLLLAAVKNNSVSLDRLDDMAERVLRPYFLLGQDKDFPTVDPAGGAAFLVYQYGHNSPLAPLYREVPARDVRRDHARLIREMGAAGTVLLKNVNGTLPLKDEKSIGVFGNDASYPNIGSVFLDLESLEGYEHGTIDIGGGSGTVRHTKMVTPLEAIQEKVRKLGGHLQILLDNNELADGRLRTIYPVPEVCLLFLKAFASEGRDRSSLELPWNATRAVEGTAAVCPNTVVIIHGPGVVLIPWADNENVTAILSAHYPGEETGNSITDVLWGLVEPSGRLPYTIPRNESDYGPTIVNLTEVPADPLAWQADFDEGQMIDYRHFDASDIEPHFEFGFGLSYTEFEMGSDVQIEIKPGLSADADECKGIAPGGLNDLWTVVASVTVSVTNVGDRPGSTVPQLYVSMPQEGTPKGTPLRTLRGFDKVYLEVGETRDIQFDLQRRDLSFWDVAKKGWVIPEGMFTFAAGFSSRDLKAETRAAVLG